MVKNLIVLILFIAVASCKISPLPDKVLNPVPANISFYGMVWTGKFLLGWTSYPDDDEEDYTFVYITSTDDEFSSKPVFTNGFTSLAYSDTQAFAVSEDQVYLASSSQQYSIYLNIEPYNDSILLTVASKSGTEGNYYGSSYFGTTKNSIGGNVYSYSAVLYEPVLSYFSVNNIEEEGLTNWLPFPAYFPTVLDFFLTSDGSSVYMIVSDIANSELNWVPSNMYKWNMDFNTDPEIVLGYQFNQQNGVEYNSPMGNIGTFNNDNVDQNTVWFATFMDISGIDDEEEAENSSEFSKESSSNIADRILPVTFYNYNISNDEVIGKGVVTPVYWYEDFSDPIIVLSDKYIFTLGHHENYGQPVLSQISYDANGVSDQNQFNQTLSLEYLTPFIVDDNYLYFFSSTTISRFPYV